MNWRGFRIGLLAALFTGAAPAQEFEIYVSDVGSNRAGPYQILRYDGQGGSPTVFATENVSRPQDIVFLEDQGVALVSNFGSNRVDRYDLETGAFIDVFTSEVVQPTRMKIGPGGLLYVLQWAGDGLVRRYELDGTRIADFTDVRVPNAIGLDWDEAGNLYVSSFNQANVRRFDPDGNDLGLFVSSRLTGPTNLWFDDGGELLVLDWSGNAVRRFDATGAFVSTFILGIQNPEGVDFLPDGNIIIGNGGTGAIPMYTPDGAFVRNFIEAGAAGLALPNAVVIRPVPKGSDFEINAGLNDAWFNPDTPGQGIVIAVYPDSGQLFAAWFTFDAARPAGDDAVIGESGHRWLTAQGPFDGNVAELTVFVTRGGLFDQAQPPASTDLAGDGTLRIEFDGCEAATVRYRITSAGLSGEFPIQRVGADNIALCEALEGMAR